MGLYNRGFSCSYLYFLEVIYSIAKWSSLTKTKSARTSMSRERESRDPLSINPELIHRFKYRNQILWRMLLQIVKLFFPLVLQVLLRQKHNDQGTREAVCLQI